LFITTSSAEMSPNCGPPASSRSVGELLTLWTLEKCSAWLILVEMPDTNHMSRDETRRCRPVLMHTP